MCIRDSFNRTEGLLAELLSRAVSKVDKAAAYRLKILLQMMRGEYRPAINSGLECLRLFGIQIPARPTLEQVHLEHERLWQDLGERSIESLVDLPLMTDREMQVVMGMLSELCAPAASASFTDSNLFCLLVCHMAIASFRYGLTHASVHAYADLALILGPVFNRYHEGYRFAKLARSLFDKYGPSEAKAYVCMEQISLWTQPITTAIEFIRLAFRTCVNNHDLTYACFCCNHLVTDLLLHGVDLEEVWHASQKGLEFVLKVKLRDTADIIISQQRFILNMRGQTAAFSSFSDAHFDEEKFEAQLTEDRMPHLVCYYWILKLQARFTSGDFDAAIAAAQKAKPLLWSAEILIESANYYFYSALTIAAAHEIGTVMKASQAVSGEIVLEQLVQTLMAIAVEHAGAERGLLILPHGEEHRIAAEAKTGRDQVEVQLQQASVTSSDLPDSLLRYVIRTQDSVILDDASVQNLFSEDEYVRQQRPRSILCLPLVKQAKLMGVLYLENNLAPGVFTTKRLAMLELLASQAAISLDHARLYADLRQENDDRRKAEEALRASEERWSNLAENSSAGIALIAPDGRFIAANLALQKMLGYTEYELQGNTVANISHEEDRTATEARIADAYEGQRRVYRVEKRYLRKDGRVMWADVSSVFVPASGSNSAFFSVVIVDITERKRAEEKLREAQTELAHVSRLTTMGEMAASIAHEVNQPLAGMITNANASLRWLAGDAPNLAEAGEAIRRIIRDGNRAGDVISRMRALFKKARTAKERFDINEAIEEVVTLTQSEVRRNKVGLRMQLAADLPSVMGDRVQLQQVVVNLILNAIEAMSPVEERERELVIRTQRGEGDEVAVAVQDSGIGVDLLSAERIFEAFHTTKPGGLGMGLSISRSIVESHGGRLWVVSNDGPGATFQFTFHS